MYKLVAVFATIALVQCAKLSSLSEHEPVPIISQVQEVNPEGDFKWSFESGDGTKQEQTGAFKTIDKDTVVEEVHGSFSYVDSEGKTHSVNYVANEQGYLPSGDDIAPEILSNLEYIASHPQPIQTELKHV
ncbi:endocuticle structural glycoprotein SgAbd-3-like [Rhynchophorus ferrugineus]|uniref:endocuticle structural glycoprotein SgAbd-3-like n=1 Tax=Rhynchophorus ferrugineus TaxID=354439 RepID=UPI003FCE19A6